ncbi:MAG TPA: 16S rRNA (cytosine(1402)-N(4))-methyltransferase RsmH [Polyangiales bacterium]|nr:16S rRNA (cytosine(1402)-N(4))-methyltransferase RsmH [Polyangiales bacterium]
MSEFHHDSVMTLETIEWLKPRSGKLYADATLGGGGHTAAILDASAPDGRVIAVDRDLRAVEHARTRLAAYGDRVQVLHGEFGSLPELLRAAGHAWVDGIVADLGVSSPQLDDAARGFAFSQDGPLDMRMDDSSGDTALSLIAQWSEAELADVLYQFGEERRSRAIARTVRAALANGELNSTGDLRRAVVKAIGRPPGSKIDPATRTFQALRIAVNRELDQLETLLRQLADLLSDDAVAVLISFHSLEDRVVKHSFRNDPELRVLTKRPIIASDDEQARNRRARSAKLRAAARIERSNDEVRT